MFFFHALKLKTIIFCAEKLKLEGGADNYNYLKQGECSRNDAAFFKEVMVSGLLR